MKENSSESEVISKPEPAEHKDENGADGEPKRSFSPDFKSNPFKLVKKKQLMELSPKHFLKEKKDSRDSSEAFMLLLFFWF